MNPGRWPARVVSRVRHPKTTVRWRLTLLYGGLFLICGAGLLAITYTLLSSATTVSAPFPAGLFQGRGSVTGNVVPGPLRSPPQGRPSNARTARVPPSGAPRAFTNIPTRIKRALASRAGQQAVTFVVAKQRVSDLHHLEVESGIALAIMAIISGVLGWLMAGRVLSPLRTITVTTQQISEASLHRRLAMPGPRDELRQLADTIDGLLERLERAFAAQRRFVANASHELRTPLTTVRALLEMVLSDPHASLATFRETCEHVLDENEQQEQLIDALLTLARGQRGLDQREPVDLQALVAEQVDQHEAQALTRAVQFKVSLDPAQVYGDRRLLARLVANLIENAIRHNTMGGRVDIALDASKPHTVLRIANSGPALTADDARRILQPFQRVARDRTSLDGGLGLGLSIVAAIADAHDAELEVHPQSAGGLEVEVRFPASPTPEETTPAGGRPAEADSQAAPALAFTRS